MGCHKSVIEVGKIPYNAEPGEYKIHVKVVFKVNLLKDFVEEFETNKFKVLEPTTDYAN